MRPYLTPIQYDTDIVQRCRVTLYEWVAQMLSALAAALNAVPPDLREHPLIRAAFAESEAFLARRLRFWVIILRRMLVAAAFERFRPTHPKVKFRRHPPSLAPGMRRNRLNHHIRCVTSGIVSGMQTGSLAQRALRFKRALDRFDQLVSRALARMHKMWRCPMRGALVLRTPHDDIVLSADALAPACADSS